MRLHLFTAGLGLALALAVTACSTPAPAPSGPSDADRAAVNELAAKYETVYNAADAAGVAALYAEDHENVEPDGVHGSGRAAAQAAIEKEFAAFKQLGVTPQLDITPVYQNWVDATHVVTGGTWTMTGGVPGTPSSGAYMSLTVKAADGSWQLANSLVAQFVPPPAAPAAATK